MDTLLDAAAAARYLGVQMNTLAVWRCKGRNRGPKFVKLEPGRPCSPIRYRMSDLEAYVARGVCNSTSEYGLKTEAA